jgi:hypothetical protein
LRHRPRDVRERRAARLPQRPRRFRAGLTATATRLQQSLLCVAFLATGCAALTGPDWTAIGQEAAQLRAGCESQFASGAIKTHLATEQCANPPIHNLYAQAGLPDMDVLDAYFARRESTAEQWDRRAIAPEEARAQFAQEAADMNSQLQNRAANRAVGAAAMRSTMPVFCTRNGPMLICQ